MRKSLQSDQLSQPERVLYRMVQDYVQGALDDNRVLYRASVVGIDHQGGLFEIDPPNPRNSIQARIITNGHNSTTTDDDLPIFWPMFPHQQMPVKENEHVYVLFEDDEKMHGLWLARIPQRLDVDSKNYVKGTAAYAKNPLNKTTGISVDQLVAGTSSDPTPIEQDPDFVIESVPEFKARVGDHVIHGSNNTIIVLGRDRPDTADDETAETDLAGTIDIVAGRVSEEMSDDDKSRVYVSMQTDIDKNMGVGSIGAPGTTGVGPVAAIGVKSDEIRVVARHGIKVVVSGGDLVLEGKNIVIGDQATEASVLGDTLKDLLSSLIDAIEQIQVNTPAGPSSPPVVNAGDFESIKGKLATALSKTVTVKG